MNRGDVDVVELGENLCLAAKAGHALRVTGELLWQDLERHLTLELIVPCAIDLAHAARAKMAQDFVVVQPSARGCPLIRRK